MMIYYQLLLPQGRYFLTESPECHCIEQSCSVCRVSKTPKLSSKDTCLGVSCLLSCVLIPCWPCWLLLSPVTSQSTWSPVWVRVIRHSKHSVILTPLLTATDTTITSQHPPAFVRMEFRSSSLSSLSSQHSEQLSGYFTLLWLRLEGGGGRGVARLASLARDHF